MALVSWANDLQFGSATIDFQHTCTCRKQLLLRGRARIGRAGASGPRASTSFWLLVRVVHLSLHENCVNACGVCKKALYPANLAWLISFSQDWWGLSLRSPQSFDYRRALVTNRPSLPSKYVVCGKLTDGLESMCTVPPRPIASVH